MCLVFVYTNLQRTDKHDIIPKCSPHTHTLLSLHPCSGSAPAVLLTSAGPP